jgi:hypothetical protein
MGYFACLTMITGPFAGALVLPLVMGDAGQPREWREPFAYDADTRCKTLSRGSLLVAAYLYS